MIAVFTPGLKQFAGNNLFIGWEFSLASSALKREENSCKFIFIILSFISYGANFIRLFRLKVSFEKQFNYYLT